MPKTIVISMVKNEADIVESFVRHALSFADMVLVTNHMSTDDTPKILQSLVSEGLPLVVNSFEKSEQAQAEVMTRLMTNAENLGATLILPMDADEFLIEEGGGAEEIREVLSGLSPKKIYRVPWISYRLKDAEKEHTRFILSRGAFKKVRREPLTKLIVGGDAVKKYGLRLTQGNHDVVSKAGMTPAETEELLVLHFAHFPWRSREQRISKALCGHLSNVARYSSFTWYARQWRAAFSDFIEGRPVAEDDHGDEVSADLSAYARGDIRLRYTTGRIDAVTNALLFAESVADSCCKERILINRRLVSIIVIYDGDRAALSKSLESAARETYPFKEIFILDISGLGAKETFSYEVISSGETFSYEVISSFEEIPGRVKGDYIQWLLPGDTIAPGKVYDSVTVYETTDDTRLVMTLADESGVSERFRPDALSIENSDPNVTANVISGEWLKEYILLNGVIVPGGIASALFRRETMEGASWLLDSFIEAKALSLSPWMDTLCGTVAVILSQMTAPGRRRWSADEWTWHQMEWAALLAGNREDVSPEKYDEAVRSLRKNRVMAKGWGISPSLMQQYESVLDSL